MITFTGGASRSNTPRIHNAMTPSKNGRRPNRVIARPTHGTTGLVATYRAVCAGKRVGLANKEVLVSGGRLVMQAVKAAKIKQIDYLVITHYHRDHVGGARGR